MSLYSTIGDGSTSFIVLCSDIFNSAFKYFLDGVSISFICNSLQCSITNISNFLLTSSVELDNENKFESLAFNLLNTKLSKQSYLDHSFKM